MINSSVSMRAVLRRSALVALASLLVVTAACSRRETSSPTPATTAQPPITIHMALFKSPAVDAAMKVLPDVERATGVRIQADVLPYNDLQDRLQTEFLAKSSRYDLVMADCIWIPKFAKSGYLRPIDDYQKDPSLTPADYNLKDVIPAVADYLGKYPAGGATYGMPFMTNSHVLAYRKDLYEKVLRPAGMREPGRTIATAWTWDEYLKAAKLLTMDDPAAPGGKQWGSSMQARAGAWIVYEWYSWLYGAGGRDIDYKTMQPTFTDPGSITAIRRYAGMRGTVAPDSVLSWGHEEETAALGNGTAAMDATWNVELTGYLVDPAKSAHAHDFAFAIPPVGANGKPTPDMGGYGLLVSQFSQHPKEAYKVLVALTSPSVHKGIVLDGGTPFRLSEMNDPAILAKYPVYAIYGEVLANSIYRARVPQWPEIEDVISKDLTKALTKELTPEQAAASMQQKVAAILAR